MNRRLRTPGALVGLLIASTLSWAVGVAAAMLHFLASPVWLACTVGGGLLLLMAVATGVVMREMNRAVEVFTNRPPVVTKRPLRHAPPVSDRPGRQSVGVQATGKKQPDRSRYPRRLAHKD